MRSRYDSHLVLRESKACRAGIDASGVEDDVGDVVDKLDADFDILVANVGVCREGVERVYS